MADCYLSINKFDLKQSKLIIKGYENSDNNEFDKKIFFIINGVDIDEEEKNSINEDIFPIEEEERNNNNENRAKKKIYDFHRLMSIMSQEVIYRKSSSIS